MPPIKKFSYVLRKSRRARRMRLAVYRDGSVVVTVPRGVGEGVVERFLAAKMQWLLAKLQFFKKFADDPTLRYGRREYLKYKEDARALVVEKIARFNALGTFHYNKIAIRDQKTCWGSCSKKGNLNFNYKILFLPEHLQSYIIAHELCHLKEFNHSKQFWNLVAECIPNHQEIRKELRLNSIQNVRKQVV